MLQCYTGADLFENITSYSGTGGVIDHSFLLWTCGHEKAVPISIGIKRRYFFNFKKNLIDRISLNSIILSIKSIVLIVQIFKKNSPKEIKDIVRKYQETHSFCYVRLPWQLS